MDVLVLVTAVGAYITGSIPTGYIVARLKGIADIRAHGSGNIGATNVSRVLGKPYFFLVFLLDAGKAFLFLYCVKNYFAQNAVYLFSGALLLGNGTSPFLRGKGGKGVATLFGILCAVDVMSVALLFGVWFAVLIITQTVGMASIVSVWSLPVYGLVQKNYDLFFFFLFCALWVTVRHAGNISVYVQKIKNKN